MSRRPLLHFVLGALLGAAPRGLRAQEPATLLGFELGYSHARFEPGGGVDEARDGSLIGGFVTHRLAGPVSAQIELLFSRKGGGVSAGSPLGPVPANAQLIYVEVPVLARVTLPVSRALHPVLLGGGSYALAVGCEFEVEGPGTITQERCDDPAAGLQLADADVSAIVGGGFEYLWRGSTVRLELRRIIGLRSIVQGSGGKNRVWAALLGITF